MDQGSSLVIVLQMIYSLNLLFSYSIAINPANQIIASYLFKPLLNKKEQSNKWERIHWHLVNIQRLIVLLAAVYCAIELSSVLDKFLSLLGALLCGPLAIMFPALIHLRTTASNVFEKTIDLLCILASIAVMVFCLS